jgi:sugar phosphate isomerase/epimerase
MRFGTKVDGEEGWGARMEPLFGERREFFEWLRKAGFGFVEFSCGDEPRADMIADYARACADAGLGVSLHPYTTTGSPEGFGVGPVQELTRGLLDLADRLADIAGRPQRLVLHAGLARTGPYALDYDEAMARAREYFQWLDEEVREHHPDVLALCETAMPAEPRDNFERLADTWETVLDLVEGTDIGICWDTGHAFLSAAYGKHDEMPPDRFLNRVRHVHMHDVVAGDGGAGGLSDHYPPGEGISPLQEYARLLAGAGYDGWVLFERSAYLYGDRGSLRQALEPGMHMLREVFG